MNSKKIALKLSTLILIAMIILVVISVFATNVIFRNEYNKRDKNDLYWNYDKILTKPYKYLKIDGGNITNIIFEPSVKPSVRVLKLWNYHKENSVSAYVKNDTLYLKFNNKYSNLNEKSWMQSEVLVRLFAPQLLAIDGNETNFEMQKMKQKNFNIKLKGKSRFEVETYSSNFDTLNVTQSDSSQVEFEMSPDLKASPMMTFKNVTANLTGYTLLDVGRGYIDHVKLNISDSSAVILSGRSLKNSSK